MHRFQVHVLHCIVGHTDSGKYEYNAKEKHMTVSLCVDQCCVCDRTGIVTIVTHAMKFRVPKRRELERTVGP